MQESESILLIKRMIRTIVVSVLGLETAASGGWMETFDEGAGDWQYVNIKENGKFKEYKPDYYSQNGNDGGYIAAPIGLSHSSHKKDKEPLFVLSSLATLADGEIGRAEQ